MCGEAVAVSAVQPDGVATRDARDGATISHLTVSRRATPSQLALSQCEPSSRRLGRRGHLWAWPWRGGCGRRAGQQPSSRPPRPPRPARRGVACRPPPREVPMEVPEALRPSPEPASAERDGLGTTVQTPHRAVASAPIVLNIDSTHDRSVAGAVGCRGVCGGRWPC